MKRPFYVILSILVAVAIPLTLMGFSLMAKKVTDLNREIKEMVEKETRLVEENERLVSEIAILKNSERIEKLAVEEGMHKAETEEIVRMDVGNKNE